MTLAELTPLQAEYMSMSIWLMSDGLTFSISNKEDVENEQIKGSLNIPTGYRTHIEAIQELIYQHEWLCFPYQRVCLYYTPVRSVLIPHELYDASQAHLWLQGISNIEGSTVLAEPLPIIGKVLLTTIDTDIITLFERIHPPLFALPYYLPLIENELKQINSGRNQKLVVSLRNKQLDCLLLNSGHLAYVNHYTLTSEESVSELLYYTLGLWQTLELKNEEDEIILLHEAKYHHLFTDFSRELKPYLIHQTLHMTDMSI